MGDDDSLEQQFALELSPNANDPGVWSPRHHPDEVATETAPAGAAVAADLARSRQLHGGFRLSAEQKRMRALVKAQEQVGRELAQLEHAGARVLHARRTPFIAQPLDHIVVGRNGIFVVVDLLSTAAQPVSWFPSGHLQTSGLTMAKFERALLDSVEAIAAAVIKILGPGWSILVVPMIAVCGLWPASNGVVNTVDSIGVGTPAGVRSVIAGPNLPARFDATDVAVMTNAVARACPSAV